MNKHYIVFVGATPSLSTELLGLTKRIKGCVVIAPGMKKGQNAMCDAALSASMRMLYAELGEASSHTEPARLSVWCYDALSEHQLNLLWNSLGKSAWIETIQSDLKNKDSLTRIYIEKRIGDLVPLLHELSGSVFAGRKHSPLSLPLENFNSSLTGDLKRCNRPIATAEILL